MENGRDSRCKYNGLTGLDNIAFCCLCQANATVGMLIRSPPEPPTAPPLLTVTSPPIKPPSAGVRARSASSGRVARRTRSAMRTCCSIAASGRWCSGGDLINIPKRTSPGTSQCRELHVPILHHLNRMRDRFRPRPIQQISIAKRELT